MDVLQAPHKAAHEQTPSDDGEVNLTGRVFDLFVPMRRAEARLRHAGTR